MKGVMVPSLAAVLLHLGSMLRMCSAGAAGLLETPRVAAEAHAVNVNGVVLAMAHLPRFEFHDAARPAAEQCGTNPGIPLNVGAGSACNLTITVCTTDGGATWTCNASAVRNDTSHTVDRVGAPSSICIGTKSRLEVLSRWA